MDDSITATESFAPSPAILSRAEQMYQEAWAARFIDVAKARRLVAEAGRLGSSNPQQQAEGQLILATCDALVGAHETALHGAMRAYNAFTARGKRTKQAHAGVVIGLVHTRLGNYDTALSWHRKSLALFRKVGDPEGEGLALMFSGGVHLDQGESRLALETVQKALILFQTHGHNAHQAQALLMLGIAAEALGDYASAHRYDPTSRHWPKRGSRATSDKRRPSLTIWVRTTATLGTTPRPSSTTSRR